MTHRPLSKDELTALEPDFVKFLTVQGIDADLWENIKKDEAKTAELLDAFSRLVWQRILENTRYLEEIDTSGIKLYKCETEKIFLIGIHALVDGQYDFLDMSTIFKAMKDHPEHFNVVRGYKAYSPDRSTEIFGLIHSRNAHVSKGELYEHLYATADSNQ
jgi:hypothetical protein